MPFLRPSSAAVVVLLSASIAGDAAMAGAPAGTAPATYRIEALTSTGLGGTAAQASSRSLTLTLSSARSAPAAPEAEHRIPAGLGLGAALPLRTPKTTPGGPDQGPDAAGWAASFIPADLTAATARTLLEQSGVLPPAQSHCSVSAQAMKQMAVGFLNFRAFGDTLKLSGAGWSLNLDRQSILLRPLMEMAIDDALDPAPAQQESPPARVRGYGWFPGLF
jgi:hypothetical protein